MSVEDVYVEETKGEAFLGILYSDKSKCSAVLRELGIYTRSPQASQREIAILRRFIDVLDNKRAAVAETYVKDGRNPPAFLYDMFALVRYISQVTTQHKLFSETRDGSSLMHNRIIAQLLFEYQSSGYSVDATPKNRLGNNKHDFNVGDIRCEVKTILPTGKIEQLANGRFRFSERYHDSFVQKLRHDHDCAKEQVGENGIIIMAPWSYKTHAILTAAFPHFASAPHFLPGHTILALSTDVAFHNKYVAFPTNRFQDIIENLLGQIMTIGVGPLQYTIMIGGFPIQFPCSSMGLQYDIEF